MKTLLNILFLCILPVCVWSQTSPGGVSSGLKSWLRADAGVTINPLNGRVSAWADQSGNGVNATQANSGLQPFITTNSMNGHPAVQMNGGLNYLLINLSAAISDKPLTVVAVTHRQSNASNQYFLLGNTTAELPSIRLGYATNNTLRVNQSTVAISRVVPVYTAATEPPVMSTYTVSATTGRRLTEYRNNQKLSTSAASTALFKQHPTGFIGGKGWADSGMFGEIAELMFFDRALPDDEMRQVSTYLNLKYGLTIPAADHLLHSMTGFNTDIFGIGRNDSWGVNQLSSKSASPQEVLDVTSEGPIPNLSYRFVGHNNLPATAENIGSGCNSYLLLRRKWRSTITGTAGNVSLRFNLTGTGINPNQCVLLIDSNGNGFSDDPSIYGTVNGSYITFSGVSLPHGATFTIGERQETLYSVASGMMSAPVWSTSPSGSPISYSPVCGRRNLVIQSGNHITLNEPIEARSVTVQSGATLSLGTESLDMNGDFVVLGTVNPGSSVVFFSGSSPQSILSTSELTLYRAVSSNPTSVSVDGVGLSMRDILVVQNGTFETGDVLSLLSTPDYQGSIGALTAGIVEGKVTIHRRHQAQVAGWVNLCAPIEGMLVSDWNDDLITSGFPGSNFPDYAMNSIRWYNETLAGGSNSGYVGVSNVDHPISDRRGYFVYVNAGTHHLDLTGNIIHGDVNLPVTFTDTGDSSADGWNLVANPYPSAINWESSGWNRTNMDDAVYIWNAELGKYSSYVNGVGNNGGSPIIPSSQSFFVMANAASPQLGVTESVKTLDQGMFRTAQERSGVLTITLSGNGSSDETTLVWESSATAHFDRNYDAYKLAPPFMSSLMLATSDERSTRYSIQSRSDYNSEQIIPLVMNSPESGEFLLSWETLPSWLEGTAVYLQNRITGVAFNMHTLRQVRFRLQGDQDHAEWQIRIGTSDASFNSSEIGVTGRLSSGVADLFFGEIDGGNLEIKAYNLVGQSIIQPVRTPLNSERLSLSLNGHNGPCLIEVVSHDSGKRAVLKLAPQ